METVIKPIKITRKIVMESNAFKPYEPSELRPGIDVTDNEQLAIEAGKFANTVFSARQLINHGHIKVNGRKVNIPSYSVRAEDSIEVKDKSKEIAIISGALASKERDVPEYIQLDEKNRKAKLVRIPKFSEVPYPTIMEPNLVIEYYSR